VGHQRHRFIALAAACLTLLWVQTAHGNSVAIVSNINFPNLTFNEAHGNGMVGWQFSLLQAMTVSQVGWYDDSGTGLSRNFQVGLWDNSVVGGPQLLGDPTSGILIPGGTQATLNGHYRVIDLPTPLSLQPGNYVLAGLDSATTPDVIKFVGNANFQNPSYLTVGAPTEAGDCPTFSGDFMEPNCFLALPGLELGPMLFTAVPEPGTVLLAIVGVLGLAAMRRRRVNA
jgi:hypothetical protein